MNILKPLTLALALTFSAGTLVAQDFQKGVAAYNSGDYAAALQEWRPLAEGGDADVQYILGLMYDNGDGVLQDYAEAVNWYRMAALQGHASAQHNLGLMHHNGRGVLQDYAEAVRWYRMASEQGDAYAQNNLGFMYQYSKGLPQDFIAAYMWYSLGAENGNELSGANRDNIAKEMTPAAISEAQRRARVCMASNYKDCD